MILDNGLGAFVTRPWPGIISTLPDTYALNKSKMFACTHVYNFLSLIGQILYAVSRIDVILDNGLTAFCCHTMVKYQTNPSQIHNLSIFHRWSIIVNSSPGTILLALFIVCLFHFSNVFFYVWFLDGQYGHSAFHYMYCLFMYIFVNKNLPTYALFK